MEVEKSVSQAGVKVFSCIQIIYENVKLAQTKDMSTTMRVRLNKLRHDCGQLNVEFWRELDSHQEIVFQDKLRRIEKILEE